MNRVVYQGVEGSFSYLTACRLYEQQAHIRGLATFQEAFNAVEQGHADIALLPIENTLAGTIYETLDLLVAGTLHIIGETHTRIEHSLLGLPGAKLQEIQKVLSHPKALAQCTRFLAKHPNMTPVAHYDTAGAAADVAKLNDPALAAIAHGSNGQIYGLQVLAQGIEDHPENFTRFFILSKQPVEGRKCSIAFTLNHQPGALAEALMFLAQCGVNLTYIVSRPLIGKPFEYMFYADLDAPNSSFVEDLRHKTNSLKILGTYNVIS